MKDYFVEQTDDPRWARAVFTSLDTLRHAQLAHPGGTLRVRDRTPREDSNTRRVAVRDGLVHVMTHAAHHRGQISAVCAHLGAPSPEMDVVCFRWRSH